MCRRPPARPRGIQALDLKGNSIHRASSPPPQHWVFLTDTDPVSEEQTLKCRACVALLPGSPPWCRHMLPFLETHPALASPPPLALTTLHPSSSPLVQAPCSWPLPCPRPQTQGHFSLKWTETVYPPSLTTSTSIPILVSLPSVVPLSPGCEPGAQHLGLGQEEAWSSSELLFNY